MTSRLFACTCRGAVPSQMCRYHHVLAVMASTYAQANVYGEQVDKIYKLWLNSIYSKSMLNYQHYIPKV